MNLLGDFHFFFFQPMAISGRPGRARPAEKISRALILALLALPRASRAQTSASAPPPAPKASPPAPNETETLRRTHTIGPRYDGYKSHAVGVGYLYLVGFPPREPFFWGVGGDARAFVADFDRLAGSAVSGLVRGTIGHAPPMTFEFAAGGLFSSEQIGGVGHVGVFFSFFYGDLGYSYQFPLGPWSRPAWLASHQLSLRAHIPLLTQ